MVIKTKDNIEMKMEQYVNNDKLLAYLKVGHRGIMEKLATGDYPKSVARKLSKVYLYWRRKLSHKDANTHVEEAFEKVKSFTKVGETEMLREIENYFKEIEDDKRLEKYPHLLEISRERLFKSSREAEIFKSDYALTKFKESLDHYDKLLFSNEGYDASRCVEFYKAQLDEIVWKLSRISRKLLDSYRTMPGYSSIDYDYGYWQPSVPMKVRHLPLEKLV